MSEGMNTPDREPNRLPHMTTAQVIERAQRILDLRGRPPYSRNAGQFKLDPTMTDDEIALISDFVHYWLQYLVLKS